MTDTQARALAESRAWASLYVDAVRIEMEALARKHPEATIEAATKHRQRAMEQLTAALDSVWISEGDAPGFLRPFMEDVK